MNLQATQNYAKISRINNQSSSDSKIRLITVNLILVLILLD